MVESGSGADAVELDTTLYVPASAEDEPAPAVVLAHGFGGSKQSMADDALDLAGRGYVVLTYSARGFGRSTGQIGLNDPRYEVADLSTLLDLLADRDEVALDGDGDPRVGVAGGSYGGALTLLGAAYDDRIDAIAPQITWNSLTAALFPSQVGPGRGHRDRRRHTAGRRRRASTSACGRACSSGSGRCPPAGSSTPSALGGDGDGDGCRERRRRGRRGRRPPRSPPSTPPRSTPRRSSGR